MLCVSCQERRPCQGCCQQLQQQAGYVTQVCHRHSCVRPGHLTCRHSPLPLHASACCATTHAGTSCVHKLLRGATLSLQPIAAQQINTGPDAKAEQCLHADGSPSLSGPLALYLQRRTEGLYRPDPRQELTASMLQVTYASLHDSCSSPLPPHAVCIPLPPQPPLDPI